MSFVVPYLTNRSKNFIDLLIKDNSDHFYYKLNAANTLTNAYGTGFGVLGSGTDTIVSVLTASTFKSPRIAKKRILYSENTKDKTRVFLDLDEYALPTNKIPTDDSLCFMRIAPFSKMAGGYLAEGPIYIIPPPNFYSVPSPLLSLSSEAPGVVASSQDKPTRDALHFILPNHARQATIINHSTVNSLFVSFGKGVPYMEIPGDVRPSVHFGSIDEVYIVSGILNTPIEFSMTFEIANLK